jgi:copper chaperone CopZ
MPTAMVRSTIEEETQVSVKKAVFEVPKMYADHHVEAVRRSLLQLKGVETVTASSAFKKVVISYDPKLLAPRDIEGALSEAGYAPGEEWQLPEIAEAKEDSSSWWSIINRVTQTNLKDLEMSGDFRKY